METRTGKINAIRLTLFFEVSGKQQIKINSHHTIALYRTAPATTTIGVILRHVREISYIFSTECVVDYMCVFRAISSSHGLSVKCVCSL